MDTLGDASLEALETRAKLQVKVHRTILRHQLIMVGNALLVAFLFAALLMLLWSALIYAGFGTPLLAGTGELFQTSARRMLQLGLVGMTAFKLGAVLFLLCPGLGFRLCGSAMKA